MRIWSVMTIWELLTTKPDWDAKWLFTIFIWIHFSLAMILVKPFEEKKSFQCKNSEIGVGVGGEERDVQAKY